MRTPAKTFEDWVLIPCLQRSGWLIQLPRLFAHFVVKSYPDPIRVHLCDQWAIPSPTFSL
jgi:hypothetical protein